jgi:hypothetical protein
MIVIVKGATAVSRKTIKIAALVTLVNERNRVSTCQPDIRHGWNAILEEVLHKADAYAGYGYLTASEVPAGQKAGVTGEVGRFTFPDESRRRYYLKTGK